MAAKEEAVDRAWDMAAPEIAAARAQHEPCGKAFYRQGMGQ